MHQGREVTGLGQYSAVKKNHCGKATRTVHQGREVTGSGQYSAIKKNHCGKATRTVHQGREVTGSGQYSAVKKIIAARLPGQCIRDEGYRLRISILLLKKNHCGKATRTVHQGREVTIQDSILLSKIAVAVKARLLQCARQAGHCINETWLRPTKASAQGHRGYNGETTCNELILPQPRHFGYSPAQHMALHCGETTCNASKGRQQPAMKHSKRLSQGQAIRPARHMALHCGETTCNETL